MEAGGAMGDDFTSGMQHVQQGGNSYNLPSGSPAWQGALFQETMNANRAVLDASAAARTSQSFGYVGGGGGSPVHLSFVSAVEILVLVIGGSLAVANLLASIHSILGLLGFVGTGYAIVKLGRRVRPRRESGVGRSCCRASFAGAPSILRARIWRRCREC